MKTFWMVMAGLLLIASGAGADEILLKNGMKITSAITGSSDQWVKVDASGITVTYYNDEIDSINGKPYVPGEIQLAQQAQDPALPVYVTQPSAVKTVTNPPAAGSPVVPPVMTPPDANAGISADSGAPKVTVTSTADGKATVTKRPIRPIEAILGMSIMLAIFAVFYLAFCYPVFLISKKSGIGSPVFAFIPILNLYLFVQLSGRPVWWFILLFVPLVNIVINVIIWMDIAVLRRKPAWLGLLILVPFANIAMLWYVAMVDTKL